MNEAESLWLEREPTLEEIKAAFDEAAKSPDFSQIEEVVFCGFGEPMERADDVIEVAKYIRRHSRISPLTCVGELTYTSRSHEQLQQESSKKTRLNTNGLVRLINPSFDMTKLSELDSVSISLNADDRNEYLRLTRTRFGASAYDEMLNFAKDAKKYTNVTLSVVAVIDPHRIRNCQQIANTLGIPLRIRYV